MKSIRKALIAFGTLVALYVVGYFIYRGAHIDRSQTLGLLKAVNPSKQLVIPKTGWHNLAYALWAPMIGADKEVSGIVVMRPTKEELDGLERLDGLLESIR